MQRISSVGHRIALTMMDRLLDIINMDIDISDMQNRYGRYGERIVMFDFTDVDLQFYLQVKDGKIRKLKNVTPDGMVHLRWNPTMIDIIRGKTQMIMPDGSKVWRKYHPITAWGYDEIDMEGDAKIADIALFETIYNTSLSKITGKIRI